MWQVLHADYNPNGVSSIYVTDYTRHPDLSIVSEKHAWSHGLDKRIVKVTLWDEQLEMAKAVKPGCYYTIHKLRMVQSTTSNQFQGRLGGAERLIHKLKAKPTGNDKLVALLEYVATAYRLGCDLLTMSKKAQRGLGTKCCIAR